MPSYTLHYFTTPALLTIKYDVTQPRILGKSPGMLHHFLYLASDGTEIQVPIHIIEHTDSTCNNYTIQFLLA